MQAVILAGGKGKRFGEYCKNMPKVMMPYHGKPILQYALESLNGLVDEAIIIIGYKKEKITEFFGECFCGIKIKYVVQEEQLGTGHAIGCCEDYVKGEFIVLAGDSIYSKEDIARIINQKTLAVTGDVVEQWGDYGVFVCCDGWLNKVVEKPKVFVSNLANKTLYKLDKEIFRYIKNLKKSERGEYEITDALQELCGRRKVKVVIARHPVLHFTKKEDLGR